MWWEHWFDNELVAKIDDLVNGGHVKCKRGRLHMTTKEVTDPLWLYVGDSLHGQNCILWTGMFFKGLDIIHSFCRYHCWKCVTRPRNVREAIQFYNLMKVVPFEYGFINPIPGKVGLDIRKHTGEPYGGFQYCTTLLQALRVKEIMLHMVTKYLPNDEIDGKHLQDTIFVKRSCTEMEGKINDDPNRDDSWWDTPQTVDEWERERRLEEMFVHDQDIASQPDWIKDKTVQKWLTYANAIGDKTAIEMVGSDIFNVQSRKYDFKDLQPKGGEAKPKPKSKKRESKGGKKKETK